MPSHLVRISVVLSVASLAVCASCGDGGGGGGGGIHLGDAATTVGEPAGLAGITDLHNQARAMASPTPSPAMPALVWSDTVAAAATAWAQNCTFEHSGNGYGENIYAAAGYSPDANDVVSNWISEASDYTYSTNKCSGECGHYTQVVWRSTSQLGCAIAQCSTNSPWANFPNWTLVVCDYSPPGNSGGKPY